jgi:diadenylate cyclase
MHVAPAILSPVGSAANKHTGGIDRRRYVKMKGWATMPHILRFMPAVPDLGLTGIVDIVVVSFLVYEALMVVRGTRAGHILIGIFVMVLLYAVALWAGLEALRSVLSFIVPYLGLAIIVLFQSEIRRTLARIGRKRWLGAGFRAPESANEILLAAEDLAQRSTGALIVLERDIGLRTFIESGVPLEALLSRDLLLSIFQPGLPLHDGAVIVQKGRIAAAACFLPLTTNPALSRTFGTRHRAAIGITEETDCLSIVVSEETGLISVAAFGELTQGLSVADVEKRINLHFDVRQPALTRTDEFAAGIPPAQETTPEPSDGRPAEKAAQP